MKPSKKVVKAWAVIDKRGKIDWRSIFPTKSEATYYMEYYAMKRVVRVEIREVPDGE